MTALKSLLILIFLSGCTVNYMAGNCTRVITEMGNDKQMQEQCR